MRQASERRDRTTAVGLAIVALASLLWAGAATAQPSERDIARGKEVFKSKANCLFCHAWHGGGESSQYGGNALSLRDTKLDREQMIEVVRCGRPSTGMPYHDVFAYTDKRCYGVTKAELGDAMPPAPLSNLPMREIEAVVDYVQTTLVGKPAPGLKECVEFWGENTRQCDQYRK